MMEPRTALIVRGGWEGHQPVDATDSFVPFLKESGFETIVSDSLDSYADAGLMRGADLIVQCWTMGVIEPHQLHGLRTAIEAGAGFAGWHGGIVDSFRNSADYLHLMGGQFACHPRGFVDYTVEVLPEHAGHPVVAGISAFAVQTEQYWVLSDAHNEVLATTTLAARPGDPWHAPVVSPAVWTRNWGAGRIFVCTIGHRLADLNVPSVRTVIERGMLWASR
jgi:type 1 glutamine amidotransferase